MLNINVLLPTNMEYYYFTLTLISMDHINMNKFCLVFVNGCREKISELQRSFS